MKTCLSCVIGLSALLLANAGMASQTRVIINLSDQRVSLVQQGRITLVSPSASGKPGWSTPRGNFSIFNKVSTIGLKALGRSSTLTEEWSTQMRLRAAIYQEAAIINPRRCRTSWNSAGRLGCTPVTFQDIPRPTDACGCREISLRCFSSESKLGRQLTVVGSTDNLARVRRALPTLPTGSYVVGKR
jgi:hypothetical protein